MTRLKKSSILGLLCSLCFLVSNSFAGGSWIADGCAVQTLENQFITSEFADAHYVNDKDLGDGILIETASFGRDLKLHSRDSDMKFNVGSGSGVLDVWAARMAVNGDVSIAHELSTASTAPDPEWEFPGRYVGNRDYNDARYATFAQGVLLDSAVQKSAGSATNLHLRDSFDLFVEGDIPNTETMVFHLTKDILYANVSGDGFISLKGSPVEIDDATAPTHAINRQSGDARYVRDKALGYGILIEPDNVGRQLELRTNDADMEFNVGSGSGVLDIWAARMAVNGDVSITHELSTASTAPDPEWEFPGRYVGNRDYNDNRYIQRSEGITINHPFQAGDILQIQNGIITAINP